MFAGSLAISQVARSRDKSSGALATGTVPQDPFHAPQGTLSSCIGQSHPPQRRGRKTPARLPRRCATRGGRGPGVPQGRQGVRRPLRGPLCAGDHLRLEERRAAGAPLGRRGLEQGTLRVGRALVREGGATLGETKTWRGRRQVNLTPRTVAVLKDHRERQLEQRAKRAGIYADHGLILSSEIGTPHREPRKALL